MKIAFVYDAVYPWMKGGGEKGLWDIAVSLRERGHEVHMFCLQFWDGPATLEREGVVMHGVRRAGEFYRPDGRRSLSEPLLFAAGLYRSLRRENGFDFIYCIVFPFFSVFSVWLHRLISGRRTPWIIAWLEIWGRKYWNAYTRSRCLGAVGAGIEWLSARCCRNHTVLSELGAQRLTSLLGVPRKNIRVIPRGLHLDRLPGDAVRQPQRVLYAGRLFAYKNTSVVVEAWPAVVARCPGAKLRILGTGPELERLQHLRSSLGLTEAIEFVTPHDSWEEAMKEIAAAEILVQPSTREGQSVIVLEAMAVGTTVIGARHPESAVSDFVRHGKNGWLVDAWDVPSAWAAPLISLLKNEPLRRELQETAQRDARGFDWNAEIVPSLERAFADCVAEASGESREVVLSPRST
ncbi:MAG: glycosyltransferase family 4 protein [Chthoniobacteraceae bacterium]